MKSPHEIADECARKLHWKMALISAIQERDNEYATEIDRLREVAIDATAEVGVLGAVLRRIAKLLGRFEAQAILVRDGVLVDGAQPLCAIRKAAVACRIVRRAIDEDQELKLPADIPLLCTQCGVPATHHPHARPPTWLNPGDPRCPSMHGGQQCQWQAGHKGPHQECMEVWSHD